MTSQRLGATVLGEPLLLAIGTQGGLHVERAHGLLSSESAGWANAGRGQGPGQGKGDRPRHWGWHGARVPCPLRVSSAPHFFLGVPACPQPWQEQISFRSGWLCRGQEEWVYCEDGRQRPKLNRPGLEGGAGPGQGVCGGGGAGGPRARSQQGFLEQRRGARIERTRGPVLVLEEGPPPGLAPHRASRMLPPKRNECSSPGQVAGALVGSGPWLSRGRCVP